MSEKCPKCGAKYVFGEALMRSFECETQTVAGDLYHESELCKARQTIALKDKEIAELREGNKFRRYANHLPSCQLMSAGIYRRNGPRCTCGFARLDLRASRALASTDNKL